MNPLKLAVIWAVISAALSPTRAQTPPELQQGPFLGHVGTSHAKVWARAHVVGRFELTVHGGGKADHVVHTTASDENDLCVVFNIDGLTAATDYTYSIAAPDGTVLCTGDAYRLQTAPEPDGDCVVRLFFGSCAREDAGTAEVWQRAALEDIDAIVLLGDTPYIDTTALGRQRERYAAFASVQPMAELMRSTSWYGTWDDHDFGGNDTDGRLKGTGNSRRAFLEYHANPSYGDGTRGIYTSFRRGPVEVFLLDTRTFAATEPSPYRQHHASLLGKSQWQWLRRSLVASTAPVKVLACGMIWNAATRPGKQDHWGSYPYERTALFEFLGKNKIGGVVLVGGDIHRSRVLRHATEKLAGYDIFELISSPMHAGIIATANAPHPGLIKDMGEPNTFLLLTAVQRAGALQSVRARFVNAEGQEHFALDLLR